MNVKTEIRGMDRLIGRFQAAKDRFTEARDYALASTGKMVREHAQNVARNRTGSDSGGRQIQSNPLGWPQLSPFTGTISANKGAKRSGFLWARGTVQEMGAGPAWQAWLNPSRSGQFALSRSDQGALKKRIRMANGGKSRKKRQVKLSTRAQPMARLRSFVRSKIDAIAGSVTIGFFRNLGDSSPDSAIESLVAKQAHGFAVNVTRQMQKFLFAIGFPTDASRFVVPPRPWFVPVFRALESRIPEHFREKFLSRMMPTIRGAAGAMERYAA